MDKQIIDFIEMLNETRIMNGFLTVDEILELGKTNIIYDYFSTLISCTVNIGTGNTIFPNVTIGSTKSKLSICNNNIFFSGTRIKVDNGEIIIGSGNEIGENSILIKCENTILEIKNECRLSANCQLLGTSYFGNGSQVLGNIKVVNCHLEDGLSYKENNPNKRGGVLKGYGTAINLHIEVGKVINGNGVMTKDMIENQENYHQNWMIEKI